MELGPGMVKWVYKPLVTSPFPCSRLYPYVVCTVRGIIYNPIFVGPVPIPGTVQCEWAVRDHVWSQSKTCGINDTWLKYLKYLFMQLTSAQVANRSTILIK